MIARLARFRVRSQEVATCEAAIRTFVGAVRSSEPRTLRYESFRLPDGVSYLHVMQFEDAAAEEHHRGTSRARAFVDVLYPRYDEAPRFDELAVVA